MAGGLPPEGRIVTCELSPERADFAQGYFDRSPWGDRIEVRVGPGARHGQRPRRPLRLRLHRRRQGRLPRLLRGRRPQALAARHDRRRQHAERRRRGRPRDERDRAMAAFNDHVQADERTENVLLSVRDGVSLHPPGRRAGRAALDWPSVFDALSEKLQATLADVRGHGTLTEADIDKAMREIRLALLEADVNFKVVKSFTATVKERCLGADVLGTLNPGQQVVKIVNEELAALMGGASRGVTFSPRPPTVIVLAGLQGSGKTTAAAKLARWLKSEHGSSVALAACDVYRPAAVDQLVKVGAPGRRRRLRAGHRPQPGRHRALGAGPRQDRGQGRPHRRHLRAPARRRGADGRARRHPRRGQAALDPARRRRDDRPGRGQRRRAVRRRRPVRRRGHEQARRRRARRRRAERQGRHRQADPLRVGGREARPVRALPPRPHGPADPRHGRRHVAHREGRGADRGGRGQGARAQDAPQRVHPRGLPQAAEDRSAAWARCSRSWA